MSTTIQTIDERVRTKALSDLESKIEKCFTQIRSLVEVAGGGDPSYYYTDIEHPAGLICREAGGRCMLRVDQVFLKLREAILKEAGQQVGDRAVQVFIKKVEETVELAQLATEE